jgi:dipeptidyl aminopeptidase/acylaminoacyl peptidase
MRWLLVALSLFLTGIASAAGPTGNGRIVLDDGADLYVLAPDGSGRIRLTFDGRGNQGAVFSPDGTRLAFLKSDGGSPRDLYVTNADGIGGARLLASHPEAENSGVGIHGIAWSPDSSRLAYVLPGQPPIRVVDARDGTPEPLEQAGDPGPFSSLEWSPDGTELVYDADGDIWAKPLDGRPARRLAALDGLDHGATWSPDGSRIAFVHSSGTDPGVYVVERDGSGLRRVGVTPTNEVGTVRWKPDAAAVVFDGRMNASAQGVWVAGAEDSVQRLLREHVSGPVPSPDGSQLLIRQAYTGTTGGYDAVKPGIYTMNGDGSCLTYVGDGTPLDWQALPGKPAGSRRDCVDLVVRASAPDLEGLRGPSYSLVVKNEGTLPTTNVRLSARFDRPVRIVVGRSSQRFCSAAGRVLFCSAERMEPNQALAVAALARPAAAAPVGVTVSATSDARDSDPASNEVALRTRIYPCWIAGTDFSDHLVGTSAGEEICARAGSDLVEALDGADRVDGGRGRDRIVGGSGRDVLVGGPGDDTILARDGERDEVDCGTGLDAVVADRFDRLRSCERLSRR